MRSERLTHTGYHTHVCLAWLLLLFVGWPPNLNAQETSTPPDSTGERRAVLLNADRGVQQTVGEQQIERLLGNVRFRQDSTFMWSDAVTRTAGQDDVVFEGNVLIVEQGDSLDAEQVTYNEATKVGRAVGNVRLSDGEVVVYAPSGIYDTRQKQAEFEEGVRLVDSLTVLTSDQGEYWYDERRAEFYNTVRLHEENTYLESDSITYFRKTRISEARGAVFIERRGGGDDVAASDTTTRTLLFAQYVYSDEEQSFSRAQGRPVLIQIRADSTGTPTDTLIVQADTLISSRQDSLQRLVAVGDVRVWQREYAAIADSVVYDRVEDADAPARENTRLYGAPMAWFEDSQVSGDTLIVKARDSQLDTLLVRSSAFVAERDTVIERINQLRGQHLVGVFETDSVRTFTVGPRAEAIRYLTDDQNRPSDVVQMSADQLSFLVIGDDLQDITGTDGIQGTIYPSDQVPQGLQLDGFVWQPERQPTKAALLEGLVLPAASRITPLAAGTESVNANSRALPNATQTP